MFRRFSIVLALLCLFVIVGTSTVMAVETLGKIGGHKWDDSNVNGKYDIGEKPVPGWRFVLYKDGVKYAQTTTNSVGRYQFSNLPVGSYTVWEGSVSNWRQTFPLNNNSTPPEENLEKGFYAVDVTSGTNVRRDFGNVKLGTITKSVKNYWWKTPIPGINVTLEEVDVPGVLENDPSLPITLPTGKDGKTTFDRLLPGTYKLTVDLPEGWFADPDINEHIINLKEGQKSAILNCIYDNSKREPRTIGFWGNWRNKYSDQQMQALIYRVKIASGNFSTLSLSTIDSFLSTAGKKDPKRMATTQYFGFWLNLASDRLGFTAEVDLNKVEGGGWETVVADNYGANDGIVSVHALMKELVKAYNSNSLSDEQWEIFKNIADDINNYKIFLEPPTGDIN